MASTIFKKLLENVPDETKSEVRLSMEIALRIQELLRECEMSQSELARKMGKDPSEIHRWLSGTHTFTTKTLAKLQDIFGQPIINVHKSPPLKEPLESIV